MIDAMSILEKQTYAASSEYKQRLEALEEYITWLCPEETKYKQEYITLIQTYGSRTPKSYAFLQALEKEQSGAIMTEMHLDNGIAQKKEAPISEGADDMGKRQKFHVELPNGEKIWLTGNTVSEAFANGLAKLGGCEQQKEPVPTLAEFVEKTYRPTYIEHLCETTIANYESYLNLNILPFLGEVRLNEIDVTMIQRFYDWMATASQRGRKKDLNAKSIERVGGLLGRIFRVATELKLIEESPIKKTLLRNNGQPAGHHKAITPEDMKQIKTLIPTLKNEKERLYMALLAYTGMRPEEARGLRWENVHLNEGYCEMVRTVTYGRGKKTVIREAGKSECSIRTIVLPTPLVQLLQQAANKEGYVLGSTRPMCYSTNRRVYEGAFQNMGMEGKCVCYDYRTTFGTELCEAGLSSKQVGDMMGHADTRMVETVYARTRHEGVMKQKNLLDELNRAYVN